VSTVRKRNVDPEVGRNRGRIGPAVRDGNLEEAEKARRDTRAALLAQHIREVVDGAPPLTDKQLLRLAGLLVSGAR
jgi:hypothetical protein